MKDWSDFVGGVKSDIDFEMAKGIDQIAKLLEMSPSDVYQIPIPLLESMVKARRSNLKESYHRYNKTGQTDIYTEHEEYGRNALIGVVNQLFGGGEGNKGEKKKGAQNIAATRLPPGVQR